MSDQANKVPLCMLCSKRHSTGHCGWPDGHCYRCGAPDHKVGKKGNGQKCGAAKLQSVEAKQKRLKRRQEKRDKAMSEYYWAYVAPHYSNHPPPPPPPPSATA